MRIWNFQGYQKTCGISKGDQEKMWNFQGSWFLFWSWNFLRCFQGKEFPILYNFQEGWSFDFSGISRGKVNKKFQGVFKKVCPQPLFFFFSGIAKCCPIVVLPWTDKICHLAVPKRFVYYPVMSYSYLYKTMQFVLSYL